MRMVRYFLESVRLFGGPIARAAHCVCSVSAEGPPRDLGREYPWTADHSVSFRWVDPDHFREWEYDATGYDRYCLGSTADVVATLDADLLAAGDIDEIVLEAHHSQKMLGFMAHVSPFGFQGLGDIASQDWWERLFDAAGVPMPSLHFQYSGWGLDWNILKPNRPVPYLSSDPRHRWGPAYFNGGVNVGPRRFFERMGETFVDDLNIVEGAVDTIFQSQIAICLNMARHDIPCDTIPLNYNFPMNIDGKAIRLVNPDPEGLDHDDDIRIFHYIGRRKYFENTDRLQRLVDQPDLPSPWPVFQSKLRAVGREIGDLA